MCSEHCLDVPQGSMSGLMLFTLDMGGHIRKLKDDPLSPVSHETQTHAGT